MPSLRRLILPLLVLSLPALLPCLTPGLRAQNMPRALAGPVENPGNGHTYYLLDSTSWTNAEAQAVALGGHLATVRSVGENQWIIDQFAGGSTGNRRLWIGYRKPAKVSAFGWTSNEAATYTHWAVGEPNSNLGDDGYTFIVQPVLDPNFPRLVPGQWNDTFDVDEGIDGRQPYGVVEVDSAAQYTFDYGYKTPFDANADQYVVATANARKYSESFGSPPALYWGPSANDVNATLTMRFDFADPTTEVRLHAELDAYNFTKGGGSGAGSCSLYGSTDGTRWTLLLDIPTPTSSDATYRTYDQDVPASLVGARSFYVQVRFYTQGAPVPSYTVAQFSRSDANRTTDVFHLSANTEAVAQAPFITSAATATATVGKAFSYQIAATNDPTGYTASGLPAGLSFDTTTGLISGTPAAAGVFNVVLGATNAAGTGTALLVLTITAPTEASFFDGEAALSSSIYYLSFPSGNAFGYYSYLSDPRYLYHFDLGYEYVFDAADGKAGVYLYDFQSKTFFYTSPGFPFPYLYDFSLNAVLYYYPDPSNPGRYNTNGVRYFYNFADGQIITK